VEIGRESKVISMSPPLSAEWKGRSVLVVTNMYPDEQNPDFGTFVHEQVEGLRKRGLNVDVLVVGGKRRKLSYIDGVRRFRRRVRER
jgi:teichuronic acid biosynthesis glycosyltransferase TuaC